MLEMQKNNKEINLRLVDLNNKSRKGLYVYVKSPGSPARYYKYSGSPLELETAKEYYNDRYIQKKSKGSRAKYHKTYREVLKGTKGKRSPVRRKAEQYLRKVRKTGKIKEHLKPGVKHSIIPDLRSATDRQLKAHIEKILGELVIDKGIMEFLMQEENLRKIKSRFEYRMKFKDDKGYTLVNATMFNKTPKEMRELLKKDFRDKEEIDGEERSGSAIDKLKKMGAEPEGTGKTGNLHKIETVIIFRRGR